MEIPYPIRLNRYLYLNNYCSRRQADKLIEQGLIKINGKKALLGQKVNEKDKVEISDKIKKIKESYRYIAYNKPRGMVSHNPQHGEKSVDKVYKDLSPLGRLDKDSTGLMILTNDGRIVDKLLNPKYDHEKEYKVKVDKELKQSFKNKMEKGVNIEGYKTKPCKVKITGNKTFSIILTEGKKHQIRRMCAALGYQVKDLQRRRFAHIKVDGIKEGFGRDLSPKEKFELLKLASVEK